MSSMKTISLLALLGVVAAPAWAQTPTPPGGAEEVIVTATRTPQKPPAVGASVSVINAAALAQRQALDVADVLRDQPGVAINRNGGLGGVASVRIRGAQSDQTVVLIDGVKINDPAAPGGGFDFGTLLAGNLDRIEVLRGPQSTLYSSQAIGGVVNLISRQPDGPLRGSAEAEIGELRTWRLRAEASGKFDKLGYALGGGRFESDGISAFNERRGGRERDGYVNTAANGRLTYDLSQSIALDARAWWSRGEVDVDGFAPPTFALGDTLETQETEQRILFAGVTLKALDGRWRNRFAVMQTDTDRVSRNPSLSVPVTFESSGVNERLEWQSTLDLTPRLQLVGGADREEARLKTRAPSSFNPNPPQARASATLDGAYLQAQAAPTDGLTATLGVRRSEDDRFGEAITSRATIAYTPNDGATVLRASVGEGFKAPTPFQLLSDFGNVSLRPEEAVAYDLGVEQSLFDRALTVGLIYFRREAKDEIDFVSCTGNPAAFCVGRPFGTYDNIAATRADGWEASARFAVGGWRAVANYTSLDARNRTPGAAFGKRLARRPNDSASLDLGYDFAAGHSLSLGVTKVGDSFDNAANTRALKGYTLVALRGSWLITDKVALYGRVENTDDEAYETATGYGSMPRQAFVGIRTTF
jgi:vitamin B12 transporter